MNKPKIVCVVVTFNRLEKLKKALAAYDSQTESFDTLVVVDNHSTDQTPVFLKEWEQKPSKFNKHVITLAKNMGGSGGFYEGEKYAMTLLPDWIHVADDDAYPAQDMMANFYAFVSTHSKEQLSAVCASVLYPNGKECLYHRSRHSFSRTRDFIITPVPIDEYKKDFFPLTIFSYVGTFLNSESLRKVGLVIPDYFIYADDGEHSLRLQNAGLIVCAPSIQIVHDSQTDSNDTDIIASWRTYYLIRNQINMIKRHYPLSLPRAIYEKCRKWHSFEAEQKALYKAAIKDALLDRLGIHQLYKPGFVIKK